MSDQGKAQAVDFLGLSKDFMAEIEKERIEPAKEQMRKLEEKLQILRWSIKC